MSIFDRLLDMLLATSIGLATLVFLSLSAACMAVTILLEQDARRNGRPGHERR